MGSQKSLSHPSSVGDAAANNRQRQEKLSRIDGTPKADGAEKKKATQLSAEGVVHGCGNGDGEGKDEDTGPKEVAPKITPS